MVITILDHVPQCYSAQDGEIIQNLLRRAFANEKNVTLSFSGIMDAPSSFINAALVPLVQEHGSGWLKAHLAVTGANKQVANMIRRCVANAERSLATA